MAVVMSAAMLVVPLLGLVRSAHNGRADAQSVAAVDTRAELSARLAGDLGRVSRSQAAMLSAETDTTEVPATTATTAAHKAPAKTAPLRRTTTTVRRSTPTTAKPAPKPAPTTTTPPKPAHDMTGGASWYNAPTGTCAMRDAPKGTVVHVTNLANGKSTTCTVSDYGPTMQSRVIDLSKGTFAEIADPAQGVIQVRVTW